jgi:REP element-mobilizing transposase RayT
LFFSYYRLKKPKISLPLKAPGTVLFAFWSGVILLEVNDMSRQARVQSPTDYYHVMMRENNRESIFGSDEQKKFFLESLKVQAEDQLIDVAAYCIMDNHVHIVVKGNISDLSNSIKRINIKYAMNFNQKNRCQGNLRKNVIEFVPHTALSHLFKKYYFVLLAVYYYPYNYHREVVLIRLIIGSSYDQ